MFKQGNPGGGRPAKSEAWKIAEKEIRALLPGLLMMKKSQVDRMVSKASDPSMGLLLMVNYIRKNPAEVVARFLPESWLDDPMPADTIGAELMSKLQMLGDPDGRQASA